MQITPPEDIFRSVEAFSGQDEFGDRSERSTDYVYRQLAPVLRRIAIRKFRIPPEDATGLVHDVFVRYLVNVHNVRGNLRAYLVSAIHNASKNYLRSCQTKERVFADDERAFAEATTDDDTFDGLAVNLVVASTLAKLDTCCSEVLRRYYMDGEDTVSIAKTMGMKPANVNYRMHVCRERARLIYAELNRIP